MHARRATAVVEDSRYLEHAGPEGHPERPERLSAVHAALAARADAWEPVAARPATPDEILRVHAREHLALVEEAARQAPARLDPDTYVAPASHEVALLASGASVELVKLNDEDHYLRDQPTRIQAVRALVEFVDEHIGPAAAASEAESGRPATAGLPD